MKKLIVILMVWCSLLVGCGDTDFKKVEGNKTNEVQVYVDPETGVNYLIYDSYRQGGITVRYNADGSIMVTEKEGESNER